MPLCPICDISIDPKRYLKTFIFDFYAEQYKQEYRLYQCSNCYLQFWWPLKFVLEFYEKYLPQHEIDTLGFRKLPPYSELFFKLLPIKSGQLLDIGCGDGVFLEYAKSSGFKVFGIDLDKKCINAAKKHRHLENVYALFLDDFLEIAKNKNLQFDVISFFDVLEHQDNPRKFLKNIKSLLKEGGYIIGSVPNRERFLSSLDWKVFMGDFPPPHLTRWTKDVLKHFFIKEGLTGIDLYPVGFDNVMEVVSWYKIVLLGSLSRKIKELFIKNKANSKLGIGDLGKINESKNFLQFLRTVSNLVLMPLALATKSVINRRGTHIYFQIKFEGEIS